MGCSYLFFFASGNRRCEFAVQDQKDLRLGTIIESLSMVGINLSQTKPRSQQPMYIYISLPTRD